MRFIFLCGSRNIRENVIRKSSLLQMAPHTLTCTFPLPGSSMFLFFLLFALLIELRALCTLHAKHRPHHWATTPAPTRSLKWFGGWFGSSEWVLACRHQWRYTLGLWIEIEGRGRDRIKDEGHWKGNCDLMAENKENSEKTAAASAHPSRKRMCPVPSIHPDHASLTT